MNYGGFLNYVLFEEFLTAAEYSSDWLDHVLTGKQNGVLEHKQALKYRSSTFSQHVLSINFGPGPVLCTGHTKVKKTDRALSSWWLGSKAADKHTSGPEFKPWLCDLSLVSCLSHSFLVYKGSVKSVIATVFGQQTLVLFYIYTYIYMWLYIYINMYTYISVLYI